MAWYSRVPSYHFGLLILECQYRLFDWPADVRMSRCSLEIGGCKLGKLVVGEVLLRFRNREGEICVCACV